MKKFITQYFNEASKKWEDFGNYETRSEAKEAQKSLKRDGVNKVRIWRNREGGDSGGNQRTIQPIFGNGQNKVNA